MGIRDDYKKVCDAPCGECIQLATCMALECKKFKSWVIEKPWKKNIVAQRPEDEDIFSP